MNFWQGLPRPFFILAPMDDVTDVVFRRLVTEAAAPDVFFTEFAAVAGLVSEKGRPSTMQRLRIGPAETKPLVAQIYGNDPEQFYEAAALIKDIGFAGIDINTGCPDKNVVKHGSGGGLIGQYDCMRDIIAATKAGAPNLPVSVKARLGLRTIITEEWAGFLLEQNLAALTMHGRTVKEMSKVPAHWDEIGKVVTLRNQIAPSTLVIGNGDVTDHAHGLALVAEHNLDGIMIGRGIFHNIHAFAPVTPPLDPMVRLALLGRHLDLYEAYESTKPLPALKRFFKVYVAGWNGAAALRADLMNTKTVAEAREVLKLFTSQPIIKDDISAVIR